MKKIFHSVAVIILSYLILFYFILVIYLFFCSLTIKTNKIVKRNRMTVRDLLGSETEGS